MSIYYKDPWLGSNPNENSLKLAKYSSSWLPFTGTLSMVDTVRNIITAGAITGFGAFTGTSNNNPLPIDFLYLTGHRNNDDGVLNWATAHETNSNSFEVQRSTDGENFISISQLPAAGNINIQRKYSYTDRRVFYNNPGKMYYRLKCLDLDGKYLYTDILSINNNISPIEIFTIYPNPSGDIATITYSISTAFKDAGIKIINLLGEVVMYVDAKNASDKIHIDNSGLPAGIYYGYMVIDGVTYPAKSIQVIH